MTSLPTDFGEKAFGHITNLASLGPRAAGTRGEEVVFFDLEEQNLLDSRV